MGDPPPYLQGQLGILSTWAKQRDPDRFLIVQGPVGVGKRHWIDATLRATGVRPVHRYDDMPIGGSDEAGDALVPVYHAQVAFVPPTTRSVLVLDDTESLPKSITGEKGELAMIVQFPLPPRFELERYLGQMGVPTNLADGNPTFAACRHAALAWRIAGVEIRQLSFVSEDWNGFRAGGDPPVEGHLLGYYCDENLDPRYWSWNRALWLADRGRVPRAFADLALDEIRQQWPPGQPRFPKLLGTGKNRREPTKQGSVVRGATNSYQESGRLTTPIIWA